MRRARFVDVDVSGGEEFRLNCAVQPVSGDAPCACSVTVIGRRGTPGAAYLALIYLGRNGIEVSRRVRWINDFSGVPRVYTLCSRPGSGATEVVAAVRVNMELPSPIRRRAVALSLQPPDTVHIVQDASLLETFDAWESLTSDPTSTAPIDRPYMHLDVQPDQAFNQNSTRRVINGKSSLKWSASIIGHKGEPEGAYLALIFLDASERELSRRMRWIDDFSGKAKEYVVWGRPDSGATSVIVGYRINTELPADRRSGAFRLSLPPLDVEMELEEAEDDEALSGWGFTFTPRNSEKPIGTVADKDRDSTKLAKLDALIEIYDVALHPIDSDTLAVTLERPVPGLKSGTYGLTIKGWARGRQSQAAAIEVFSEDRMIRTLAIDIPRPDIAKVHPTSSDDIPFGFHELVSLLGIPFEFELTLRVALNDGSRYSMATIRGRRQPLNSGFEPRLRPLLITSLGRSGSTWLMRLLASHPGIVALRQHPYESRMAQYWLHVLQILSRPADPIRSSQFDPMEWSSFFVGPNPYFVRGLAQYPELYEWHSDAYVEQLTQFCQRCVDNWYRQVSFVQDQSAALYFAEKQNVLRTSPLFREVYPNTQEIFLVRDFRDVASSMMAFAEQRRLASWRPGDVDEVEFLRYRQADALRLVQQWRIRADRAHLTRYEDLVQRPAQTIASLLAYLELDTSPSIIETMIARASIDTPELRGHQTSRTPQESVGRWRKDLSHPLQILYNNELGAVLREFGYDQEM